MVIGRDKYRFYVQWDGVTFIPVLLTKPVSITGSKEEKLWDYRRKSSEWRLVRYENVTVYDAIIARLLPPYDLTTPIRVKVELWDNWIDFTSVEFLGYVPLEGFQINSDNGTIIMKPEEEGTYTWYEEHKEDKQDLVSQANIVLHSHEMTIEDTSGPVEFWVPYRLDCDDPLNNLLTLDWGDGIARWDPMGIYMNDQDSGGVTWRKLGWVIHPDYYTGIDTYFYCIQSHLAVPQTREPGHPLCWSGFWARYDYYPYDRPPRVQHVIQQRANFALPGFKAGDDTWQGSFTGDTAFEDATNCPRYLWAMGAAEPVTGQAIVSGYGNAKMSEVMALLLTGSGLTFKSDFFSLATNPVTGGENKLANLILSHKLFLKGTNDDKTKGEITLQTLITALCDLFNCYWYIDIVNNQLVIEHMKYFENGKSYSGSPLVYTDLTDTNKYKLKYQVCHDINGGITDNEFNFGNQLPQKETFELTDTVDSISEILYSSNFSKKGVIETHRVDSISTDLLFILQTDKSDDGYCLLAADAAINIYRRDFLQGGNTGTLRTNYPNGDLFFDNLLNDFWVYSRYFLSGKVNNVQKSFTTQKRNKKQKQITFPRLEAGSFDPFKLITTNMGNGEIKDFELFTDTDFITVSLIY